MFLLLLSVATAAPQPAPAVALEMNMGRSCAILEDGSAWCWGVFLGHLLEQPAPLPLTDITELALGIMHTCALREAGDVWCWGGLSVYRPGLSLTPTPMAGVTEIVELDGFDDLTCALSKRGEVTCWGGDSGAIRECGAYGSGPPTWSMEPWSALDVPGARALTVGQGFVCVLDLTGAMRCTDNTRGNPHREALDALGPLQGLDAGSLTLTGRLADGRVLWWYAWDYRTPNVGTALSADGEIREVLAAASSTSTGGACNGCALVDEQAICWGENGGGQAGQRGPTYLVAPRAVPMLPPVRAVAAGGRESCAIAEGGEVWCWGGRRGWIPQPVWGPPLEPSSPPPDLVEYASEQTLQAGERVDRDQHGRPMVVPALACPAGTTARHGRPDDAAALWRWKPEATEATWCEAEGVRDGPFVARGGRVETVEGAYTRGAQTGLWIQWMNKAPATTVSHRFMDGALEGVCEIAYPGTGAHWVFTPTVRHTATLSGGQLDGPWSLHLDDLHVSGQLAAGEPVGTWRVNGVDARPVAAGEITVTAGDAGPLLVLASDGAERWMAYGAPASLPRGTWDVLAVDVKTNAAFRGSVSPDSATVDLAGAPVPLLESCRLPSGSLGARP
ncbi:MAG: hypothetical protein H6739_03570 [Alphaproteobacteria bacterium]|nr:hypothetical protein [Alphaproteobacteria bacterium]